MHQIIEFIIGSAFYLLIISFAAISMYKNLFLWIGNKAYFVILIAITTILVTIVVLTYTNQIKIFIASTLFAIDFMIVIVFLISFLFDPTLRVIIINKFKVGDKMTKKVVYLLIISILLGILLLYL